MCDNPSPSCVVWTATLAIFTRTTIGAGRLIEAIFASMWQFVGFAEYHQLTPDEYHANQAQ
jgi:hypothetical protein